MQITPEQVKQCLNEDKVSSISFEDPYCITEEDVVDTIQDCYDLPFSVYPRWWKGEEIGDPFIVFEDKKKQGQLVNGISLDWGRQLKTDENNRVILSDQEITDLTDKVNAILEYIEENQ